jgi:hypothetical protein
MIGVLTRLIKTITMLKNILKLEGTQKLTRGEQKSINGGKIPYGCLRWSAVKQTCLQWDPAICEQSPEVCSN